MIVNSLFSDFSEIEIFELKSYFLYDNIEPLK